jgi:hypothetical protein
METAKAQILQRLHRAIEKLKEARKEIHEAIQDALELKQDSDCIADQVMSEMAALATDDLEAFYIQMQEQETSRTLGRQD